MKKNHVVISVMGGIGDQIFQYGFGMFLRRKFNCELIFDNSYYRSSSNYNKFKFILADIIKKKKIKYSNKISIFNYRTISYLRFLNQLKLNKLFPNIFNYFFKIKIKNFIYEYFNLKKKIKFEKNSYYFGYWHNLDFLKKNKHDLIQNLINKNCNNSKIKKFIKLQLNNRTVAIHIRGGDFTKSKSRLLNSNYYLKSVNFYVKKLKNPNFHIFTNDVQLAEKLLPNSIKNYKYLFINKYKFSDIFEFSLFSKYKYAIMANSTFSLMSSYLSLNRKLNIVPRIWFKGKKLEPKKKFTNMKFI
jgi:hypothetical protein